MALLPAVLLLLGCGFLVANLRLSADFVRYLRRRRLALLTWPGPRPRYYGLMLATGVALGCLVFFKLVFQRRPPEQAFGELMMFAYYGYLLPLSRRIGHGFYEDGIWSESGFMPYWQIGGIAWREGEEHHAHPHLADEKAGSSSGGTIRPLRRCATVAARQDLRLTTFISRERVSTWAGTTNEKTSEAMKSSGPCPI